MKVKVSVRAICDMEAAGVEEVLEALRAKWRRDETVRNLLTRAAEEGYILVDTKDMPPHYIAALHTVLSRLRDRLGKEPSTLTVKKGGKGKEEHKGKTWIWEAPEGVRYTVHPYDLTPKEERYWSYGDRRVEEARKWVEDFLAGAEVEEKPSFLEEALAHEDNPHFQQDLLPEDLQEALRSFTPWKGSLKELQALVDGLPAREERFKQAILSISALVEGDKLVAVKLGDLWEVKGNTTRDLEAIVAMMGLQQLVRGEWNVHEVRPLLRKAGPYIPNLDLEAQLEAISALRRTKWYLEQYGRRRQVLVYRDPATGEPVLRYPVIG